MGPLLCDSVAIATHPHPLCSDPDAQCELLQTILNIDRARKGIKVLVVLSANLDQGGLHVYLQHSSAHAPSGARCAVEVSCVGSQQGMEEGSW